MKYWNYMKKREKIKDDNIFTKRRGLSFIKQKSISRNIE